MQAVDAAVLDGERRDRRQREMAKLSRSPPPFSSYIAAAAGHSIPASRLYMLSAPPLDLTFDDDSDPWPTPPPLYHRPASVGNSWGVTSIGRGFDWGADPAEPRALHKENLADNSPLAFDLPSSERSRSYIGRGFDWNENTASPKDSKLDTPPLTFDLQPDPSQVMRPVTNVTTSLFSEPFSYSPSNSRPPSPHYFSASGRASPLTPTIAGRIPQRISLIAGRISIATIEPPDPVLPQGLLRASSASSLLSLASSTRAPSPFVIEAEIGRGAYGLVKRAREIGKDGPPLIIKQIIKSRILADCWKKHPKHGTIPIEIYVMSSISQTTYVLPPRRPWDPARLEPAGLEASEWVEGSIVNGHPNICPLLDFFEDNHYYYLVLPSTLPEQVPGQPPPPSDLFDLVESFPQGLPPASIRSYLGQLADALAFLHSRGIVHRDVKDENVVLGPHGKCILIDFGSSGLVKRGGWDTFSGTLDYAGPEILRGERYEGKEQDVWAFGVVAYVLLVGECPFMTPAEAQDGLESPFANASIALDERCGEDKERDGTRGGWRRRTRGCGGAG
ncbi:kinase-like protein [Mycena filopes]|nr:kinase-like protein [Mycena filopes]